MCLTVTDVTLFDVAKQAYVSFEARLQGPKSKTKNYGGTKLKITKLQNLKLKFLDASIFFFCSDSLHCEIVKIPFVASPDFVL